MPAAGARCGWSAPAEPQVVVSRHGSTTSCKSELSAPSGGMSAEAWQIHTGKQCALRCIS